MGSEQKRLFLALILSGLVLFGWQTYFAPKKAVLVNDSATKTSSLNDETVDLEKVVTKEMPADNKKASELQTFDINGEKEFLKISNHLEIIDIATENNQDKFDVTVGPLKKLQFYIVLNSKLTPLSFLMSKVADGHLQGVNGEHNVKVNIKVADHGQFNWQLSSPKNFKLAVKFKTEKKEDEARQIRQFVQMIGEVERDNIDSEEFYEGSLSWLGLDYHYHLFAILFDQKLSAQTIIKNNSLIMKSIESKNNYSGTITYTLKELDHLQVIGKKLDLSIDYGIFGIIAVPLLKGLKFFYSFIPNYGLAIILLTLLIRTLLFPLQFKSFKSMKKMQKLQPQLQKVKEKYKDDPARVQKETMELFKKNGANPLGGCLPLVLQMPVFFAMYQVFLHSVELLGAPFMLWIHDLSAKDPYYVLPVLMGASFFLQTKLNPSTNVDPNQQKIMLIMPLIFPFFMKDLPAGLNLYMFVSTAFGIIQQMIVYKAIDD
jgi:YidC/Oxa1 family membrane protein insertase